MGNEPIGIRREDLYAWERRVALVPDDVRSLSEAGHSFIVQPSSMRAFSDDAYRQAGADMAEDLSECPLILGLKEIPADVFQPGRAYAYFSHTIKGQPSNMPRLQRALDLGCTILDYERIVDEGGRRLLFFGNYAGYAGAVDTLWTLGRRLAAEGMRTPFEALEQTSQYESLEDAMDAVRRVGQRLDEEGLPESLSPLVIGVTGYGNVSRGAQAILDLLPIEEVSPAALRGDVAWRPAQPVAKAVFREEDTVRRLDPDKPFSLTEYLEHPERYRADFARYLPTLHALINCIYWEPRYPRLVSIEALRSLFDAGSVPLRVIGDITCDVRGSIEVTVKATEPDDPVYVYDLVTDEATSGVEGRGPAIVAVDILPSELPREASSYFSRILRSFVPALSRADYRASFDRLDLPPELKRAVIAHRGALTPTYRYLENHLSVADSAAA